MAVVLIGYVATRLRQTTCISTATHTMTPPLKRWGFYLWHVYWQYLWHA